MRQLRRYAQGAVLVPAMLLAGSAGGQDARRVSATRPAVVYSHDFEKPVGPEWSARTTAVTPKGKRRFLGPFVNHVVSLTLKDLPPHRYVRLRFELFVMMTWDGGDLRDPDIWKLKVKGGPRLICTTFGTSGPGKPRGVQTFPSDLPGPLCPRASTATEEATLGYAWGGDRLDNVYRICPVFPHTGKELTLVFSGSALQAAADESWGLDNVRVELLAGPRPLSPKQLDAAWEDLLGGDPAKAFDALWRLVGAGDQAARTAAGRLKPPKTDDARLRRLIAQLDSDEWKKRDQATRQLKAMGPAVAPTLTKTLEGKVTAEVRTRIEGLLKRLVDKTYRDDEIRCLRVIRLMRLLGTPKSAGVLASIARSGPSEEVRLLAAAAGRRLEAETPKGWLDLLRRVDPHTRRANGEWVATGSGLFVSPVSWAKLAIPVAPRGDYELAAEFVRRSGSGDVNFVLPVGKTGVLLALDDNNGGSYLQNIDGKDSAKLDVPPLAVGKRQRLHVVVRQRGDQAEISAALNGKRFLNWRGPAKSLTVRPSWAVSSKPVLGLGAHGSMFAFYRLDLRMLSGKAEPLKLPLPPPPPRVPRVQILIKPRIIIQREPEEPPFPP